MRDRKYSRAVMLLKLGQPLPVDLSAYLEAQGYDLSALEARYSL